MPSRRPTRALSALFLLLALGAGCGEDDEVNCDDMQRKVYDLIEANQSCTMNADCVAGPSLECFTECGSFVNRKALADVTARGNEIIDNYKDHGCSCAMASCAEQVPSHFACVQHVCTSVPDDI